MLLPYIPVNFHVRIQRGGGRGGVTAPPPPWKIKKNIGFLSNSGSDPLKSYKASIQCRAIIRMPAKHHLNGVSLAGWWWPPNSGILILHSLIKKKKKKKKKKEIVKFGPPLTKVSGSTHDFSVTLEHFPVFQRWTSTMQSITCLVLGHNTVPNESWTSDPSILSPTFYYWATALLDKMFYFGNQLQSLNLTCFKEDPELSHPYFQIKSIYKLNVKVKHVLRRCPAKGTSWHVCPCRTLISLCIHAVWSVYHGHSTHSLFRRKTCASMQSDQSSTGTLRKEFLQVENWVSDQTCECRLIWITSQLVPHADYWLKLKTYTDSI